MHIKDNLWSFVENVENLFRWFPVVWHDRDYDFYFLYRLLEVKLDHMEKFYNSKYTYSADADKAAKEIKHAKDRCHFLANHDYGDYLSGDYISMTDEEAHKELKKAKKQYSKDKHEFWSYVEKHIDSWWD